MGVLLVDCDRQQSAALRPTLEQSALGTIGAITAADLMRTDVGRTQAVVIGQARSLADRADSCRALRDHGFGGAIVVVCAHPSESEPLLAAGADDFVVAPSSPSEVTTRLRSCLRRIHALAQLRWGPLELDRVRRIVRVDAKTIPLTARECELLACLIEASGGTVTRAKMRERVCQRKEDRGSNLVEVHLSRLREKLAERSSIIETVRGIGYRLQR